MKIIIFCFLVIFNVGCVLAQKSNKTVQSIIEAEQKLIEDIQKENINKTFLEFSAENCITFKPNLALAKDYYANKEVIGKLLRKPEYAIISKSGDFGFTTGPYIYNDFEKKNYGHYVSVWKTDKNKRWKIILDVSTSHKEPNSEIPEVFLNPDDYNYPKMIGPQKIQMREDIVFSTDELLGKSLSKSGNSSLLEFYDNSVRLYFPNHLPEFGKAAVLEFIRNQKLNITSKPIATDRAFSGDLAFTYGDAIINDKKYSYTRIWQIDNEKKWNIIIDAYLPI